jgi:hypothetical protein
MVTNPDPDGAVTGVNTVVGDEPATVVGELTPLV